MFSIRIARVFASLVSRCLLVAYLALMILSPVGIASVYPDTVAHIIYRTGIGRFRCVVYEAPCTFRQLQNEEGEASSLNRLSILWFSEAKSFELSFTLQWTHGTMRFGAVRRMSCEILCRVLHV